MSKSYTTVQGDMWDNIAHVQLGGIEHTDKLINLNRQYRDIYIFPAGMTLQLPEIIAEDEPNLPPWRRVNG